MRRLWLCAAVLSATALTHADTPLTWATGTVKLLGQERTHSAATGRICYDFINTGDYYDIGCMDEDGTDDACVTCSHGDLNASKHHGMPRLSPDGQWLMFQSQNANVGCTDEEAYNGRGFCNDIFVMPAAGGTATRIRDIGAGQVLHPQWHPSGAQIMWAEQTGGAGTWLIRIAPITFPGSVPTLGTIVNYAPGDVDGFYEPYHWFGANNQFIVFACIVDASDNGLDDMDLCTLDLLTGALVKLTDTDNVLDEHAHPTNDGTERFIYSTSTGNASYLLIDYWIMDWTGGNKQRISFFNDPGHPMYVPTGITAFGVDWLDANTFLGSAMYTLAYPWPSNIYRFDFGATRGHRRALPLGVRVNGR